MGFPSFRLSLKNHAAERCWRQAAWDLSYGAGGPSVCTSYDADGPKTEYLRNPNEGIEHLAVYRSFPSRENYVELAEDFRLYHNLFYDAQRNVYLKLNDDGQEEEAAIILVIRIYGMKVDSSAQQSMLSRQRRDRSRRDHHRGYRARARSTVVQAPGDT